MRKEFINFMADDGALLNGYINKNDNYNKKILIEIHGMTSNCSKKREAIIAEEIQKSGIDALCINTRGSEVIKYIKFNNGNKQLGGTAYENIEDSYYDIIGAIKYAERLGYESIFLQGHSLGATKVVYTYKRMNEENNRLLSKIKGIILLSLVDIPDLFKKLIDIKFIQYAEEKEQKNELLDLMPINSFIHTLSIKTFLQYTKYYKNIDFVQYTNDNYKYETLNNIKTPLFIRWGNENELLIQEPMSIVNKLNNLINNPKKDINIIDGADHTYNNKEQILANQIRVFLDNIREF